MKDTKVMIQIDRDRYINSKRKVCETDVFIIDNSPHLECMTIRDFNNSFSSALQTFRNAHNIPVSEIDNIKMALYTTNSGYCIHCRFSYQKQYSCSADEMVDRAQAIIDEHLYK